jgi:hypothetical protein
MTGTTGMRRITNYNHNTFTVPLTSYPATYVSEQPISYRMGASQSNTEYPAVAEFLSTDNKHILITPHERIVLGTPTNGRVEATEVFLRRWKMSRQDALYMKNTSDVLSSHGHQLYRTSNVLSALDNNNQGNNNTTRTKGLLVVYQKNHGFTVFDLDRVVVQLFSYPEELKISFRMRYCSCDRDLVFDRKIETHVLNTHHFEQSMQNFSDLLTSPEKEEEYS